MSILKLSFSIWIQVLITHSICGQDSLITSLSRNEVINTLIKKAPIKPLEIGDVMPNIQLGKVFGNMSQLPDTSISIGTFRGKLLILDFWASTCGACIASFPKIKKLQEDFGEAIQILPIGFTSNGNGDIFNRMQKWNGTYLEMKLPTIIELKDKSYLQSLFPFQSLPMLIWIDKTGKIIGISDHYSLNENNIKNILAGEKVSFRKVKFLSFLEPNQQFLIHEPRKLNDKHKTTSASAPFIDTLIASLGLTEIDDLPNQIHIAGINSTIQELFRSAYRELNNKYSFLRGFSGRRKTFLISTDGTLIPDRDILSSNTESWELYAFEKNNLFNYEVVLNPSNNNKKKDVYKKILFDMESQFNLKSSIEFRKTLCYELTRLPDSNLKYDTKSKKEKIFIDDEGILHIDLQAEQVIEKLNGYTRLLVREPIVNGTNIKDRISISISSKESSMNVLRSELNKCGFDLVLKEKLIESLVIRPR